MHQKLMRCVAIVAICFPACVPVSSGGDGGLDGGEAQAGSGGEVLAGAGGEAQAGSGGEAQAGSGGEAQAGAGGEAQAGSGGEAQAGSGGEAQAGSGGEAQAGSGGEVPPPEGCEDEGLELEAEPNNDIHTPSAVASAQPIQGAISTDEDEDWFVFTSCGERILEIELTNAPAVSSPVDLIFEIYGAEGELEISEAHDYNGDDGITRLFRRVYLPEAGEYLVQIYDHGGDDVDDALYQLTLTARPVPDAALEPNGNTDNIDLIKLIASEIEDSVPMTSYLASEDDDDWFALEVPGESILKLDLHNEPAFSSPIDLICELYAPDVDTKMGEEHDYDGGDETTRLTRNYYLENTGTYYINIYDHGGDDSDYDQPFEVTASLLAVPDADLEPNGNSGNEDRDHLLASPIQDGVTIQAFIASEDDEDWFKLEATGEHILNLTLTNAPAFNSTLDLIYQVFNETGEELGEEHDYDGGDETIYLERNIYIPAEGAYYIRVHDHGDDDYDYEQPFQLTATLLDVPDGDAEPNGNSDNPDLIQVLATEIMSGQEIEGFIASEDDNDWYVVHVVGAGALEIRYTNAPALSSSVDPIVQVFEGDADTEIDEAHDYDGGDETSLLLLSVQVEPGDYYIQVHDHGDDDYDYAQGYSLSVTHP